MGKFDRLQSRGTHTKQRETKKILCFLFFMRLRIIVFMNNTPKTIRLSDYRPSDYLIDTTTLYFSLSPSKTAVHCTLVMRPNMGVNADAAAPLILDGEELTLKSICLNDVKLTDKDYRVSDHTLTIFHINLNDQGRFTLETRVEIAPEANTSLSGLYTSKGMFCTQCEAQGFRRITYYLDRPDVMSRFFVYMEANLAAFPVLLSNGNKMGAGTLENNRHWARWEDPYPKPSYLFALVAGNLACVKDSFTTMGKKTVALRIFVEKSDIDKVDHAMASLKQAFAWDEQVYGREYDLDLFNIVAVSHFNMGAMENKSLNIFNTALILANPETATDTAHDRVRDVIAHEYFHNWSGNRVTCRDWHQLSLKEGFTVYRDGSFSADHSSPVVKRIEDADYLRTHQFKEDAGPTAHAVLPAAVQTFDNFYTLTIYEKGAEIIGMYRTLLGDKNFFNGTDLYFTRHDGQAVTIEAFARAMEDTGKKDLSQFRRWYHQAGTPHVTMEGHYDPKARTFALTVHQTCRPTPETKKKQPFLIPLRMGLLDDTGRDIPLSLGRHNVVEITRAEETFVFEQVPCEPVPSLFRHFSAPVTWDYPYTNEDLLFLMQHDNDGFNRWDACQKLAEPMLLEIIAGSRMSLENDLIDAYRGLLTGNETDRAMVARMMTLPTEAYLSQQVDMIDPDAIHEAAKKARCFLAQRLETELLTAYTANSSDKPYDLSIQSKARRSLRNVCLEYLCALEKNEYITLARSQYDGADNMTEKLTAFRVLAHSRQDTARRAAIADFYAAYRENQLVVDMWFGIQAASPLAGTLDVVKDLLSHDAFDPKSPNDIRAVVATFAANARHFHNTDGRGYAFVADYIIRLHQANAQMAARLVTPFAQWQKYDAQRQQLMKSQLERIIAVKGLSTNVHEQVSRCLSGK